MSCRPQCSLKLDLLRAAHYKLSAVLSELEGTPRPRHPVRNISIRTWKDKVLLQLWRLAAVPTAESSVQTLFFFVLQDSEHSVVRLTRPVKLRRTPFRSRQSLRASIIYKGAAPLVSPQPLEAEPSDPAATQSQTGPAACGATLNGAPPPSGGDKTPGNTDPSDPKPLVLKKPNPPTGEVRAEPGRCRALYSFTSQQEDQLSMKEGNAGAAPRRSAPQKQRDSAFLPRRSSGRSHQGRRWLVVR